ncbi:MAG: DUF5011 domain-containing protein [Bacteroidales bacterium]
MYKKILTQLGLFISILVIVLACKEVDDVPPIITREGADSLNHSLNQPYIDKGATAYDETDGDISRSIYVDNDVDVNFLREYQVIYHAIDKAGNEDKPVSRSKGY